MKLKEFFIVTQGAPKFTFSEKEKPLPSHDFWKTYRSKPEWEQDIENVKLIPRRKEESGLWFDDVICVITLKGKEND